MGIMMTKEQDRNSELNDRIAADLRTRARSSSQEVPNYVDDSAYIKDTKKTGRFTWVWIVLVILAIISLVCILFI